MAKISEMDPAAAGAELYRQYMSAHDAWLANRDVRHPSFDCKAWRIAARDAGTLREPVADDENTGLGPREIERTDHGADNPPPTPGTPRPPVPAADGRFALGTDSVPRFEFSDGRVVTGAAAIVARASQSNPERVRRMAAAIPGYSRVK